MTVIILLVLAAFVTGVGAGAAFTLLRLAAAKGKP